MELFRVRLNCIDHYQTHPTPYDPQLRRNVTASQIQSEPKVPVIRVFGSTETGQKVCAHIHGAFPYLYIEYSGTLNPDEVGEYIHQLHLSIDHALGVSYRRNVYDGKNKYVARITLVKGVPFYGYYVGYHYFLKIYMLNPMVMTRLSDLLLQGVVMNKMFQPFEAHLQYLLQWMTDYNLYGCGYIDSRKAYFRSPVPKYEDMENSLHLWHNRSIPSEYVLREGILPRVSHCSIEVDICVQDILNRMEIKPRPLHHDFIERLNPLAPDEKLVHSMAGLWRDETRRRKSKMVDSDPGSSPFPPEVMISMSADSRNSQKGGWIHEEEYMEGVHYLILEEKNKSNGSKLSFDTFVESTQFGNTVKTALEAVEDLYPENLGSALCLKLEKIGQGIEVDVKNEELEVDAHRISNFHNIDDDDDFPYDSDDDIMGGMNLLRKNTGDYAEEKPIEFLDKHEHEHDVDDESRPGGNQFKEQFSNFADQISARMFGKLSENDTALKSERDGNMAESAYILSQQDVTSDSPDRTANIDASPPPTTSEIGIKRQRSQTGVETQYNKRQRIYYKSHSMEHTPRPKADKIYSPAVDQRVLDTSNIVDEMKTKSKHDKSWSALSEPQTVNSVHRSSLSAALPKRPSQESLKPTFPVVKDPLEPSTISRLSQGNSSQKSTGTSPNKDISFSSALSSSRDARRSFLLQNSSMASVGSDRSEAVSKVLGNIEHLFPLVVGSRLFAVSEAPPTAVAVMSTMQEFNLPPVIYQDAYYSNESDVPERAREWAGREFKLESLTVPFLPDFDATGSSAATFGDKPGIVLDRARDEAAFQKRRRVCGFRSWEIGEPPPTLKEVLDWLSEEDSHRSASVIGPTSPSRPARSPGKKSKLSQIEGLSQKSKHEFNYTQRQKNTSVQHEAQYMSTMSLEIHVNTRSNFVPNPEEDEVQCIFWCLQSDEEGLDGNGITKRTRIGIVVLSEDGSMAQRVARQVAVEVHEETSELDLLVRMVQLVRMHDPDILTGYEVHGGSWGYLIERARLKYDYNLCDEFSRMKSQSYGRFGKDNDKWGFNNTSTIRVTGRHMINIWRAMRSELNLLQYTMENVVFHQLHRRIPHYSWRDLTNWYSNGKLRDLEKVLIYYVSRVQLDLEILEQNELISRTSEQARLLGVDFFSVFSRGSQFKVESLMFRIAKPENFLLVSPSRKQIGGQNALECLPLVMEPQSAFYNSPLLVLDFQSLYPSVMIAYNYCYSTFLGRVVNWRGISKMGFTEYKRQHRLLELLQDHINIAPNGMMYVKPEIRKSLLAKMLVEILETRVMVKSGMKLDKEDRTLQRLLNNRQLALKLIANVTYGYTSASFSGRMPCSEIADSIVQTSRETLERAIALIHSVKCWGAEVVYGDTDSLFVYLKGRTKDQAFDIGNEIAKKVTNMNPRPVKLKFEKVYFPSVLLAKKRYVGFKYESKDQKEPDFDAKGIETVRRDGTPAEQKIEETALKILFRTADLSQVKGYFQKQCEKIMKGSVSIQDFCFAKEVKLGTYSENALPPPGALISTRRMLEDARAEPQYGERVPYVVITGAPGARLIDRCVAPETLLNSDHNELDAEYYITKNIIPPLERIFNLVGANVRNWYDEMPKVQRIRRVDANLQLLGESKGLQISKKTLESYMKSSSCLVCREKLESECAICPNCLASCPVSLLTLRTRLSSVEKKSQELEKVCQSCSGITWLDEVKCDSKDCPAFYSRTKQKAKLKSERAVVEPVMKVLQGNGANTGKLDW